MIQFTPFKKFIGIKEGMAFKLGDKGIWYYHDMRSVVAISLAALTCQLAELAPAVNVLDELMAEKGAKTDAGRGCCGDPLKATLGDVAVRFPADTCPSGGRQRARHRRRPQELQPDRDEHCITRNDDGSLASASKFLCSKGWWAIDTVNPNAWAGVVEYM